MSSLPTTPAVDMGCSICHNFVSPSTAPPPTATPAGWSRLCSLVGVELNFPFCSVCTTHVNSLTEIILRLEQLQNQLKRGVMQFKNMLEEIRRSNAVRSPVPDSPPNQELDSLNFEEDQVPPSPFATELATVILPQKVGTFVPLIPPCPKSHGPKKGRKLRPRPETDISSVSYPVVKRKRRKVCQTPEDIEVPAEQRKIIIEPEILGPITETPDGRKFYEGHEILLIDGSYSCGTCGYREQQNGKENWLKRRVIKMHVKAEHLNAYRCEPCEKNFTTMKTLCIHRARSCPHTALQNPLVQCPVCDKPVSDMAAHLWTHKSQAEKNAAEAKGEATFYQCKKCFKNMGSRVALYIHHRRGFCKQLQLNSVDTNNEKPGLPEEDSAMTVTGQRHHETPKVPADTDVGEILGPITQTPDGRKFYEGHEILLDTNGTYSCGTCGYQEKQKGSWLKRRVIKMHVKAEHLNAYRCEPCDKKFTTMKTMNLHRAQYCPHTAVKPLKEYCLICGNPVTDMKRHLLTHKDQVQRDPANSTDTRKSDNDDATEKEPPAANRIVCAICGRPCHPFHIPRHEWTHKSVTEREDALRLGQAPKGVKVTKGYTLTPLVPCTICGKPIRATYRKHHMDTHKGPEERQLYDCPVEECNYKSRQRSVVKRHYVVTHVDPKTVRLYSCTFPGCDRSFRDRTDLNSHKYCHKLKTKEKKHVCGICFARFPTKGQLCGHNKNHRPAVDYKIKCTSCPQLFAEIKLQKRHLVVNHGEKCTELNERKKEVKRLKMGDPTKSYRKFKSTRSTGPHTRSRKKKGNFVQIANVEQCSEEDELVDPFKDIPDTPWFKNALDEEEESIKSEEMDQDYEEEDDNESNPTQLEDTIDYSFEEPLKEEEEEYVSD